MTLTLAIYLPPLRISLQQAQALTDIFGPPKPLQHTTSRHYIRININHTTSATSPTGVYIDEVYVSDKTKGQWTPVIGDGHITTSSSSNGDPSKIKILYSSIF